MLPESPRWLYSQGKTAEAEDVLQYIALGNGKERLNLKLKPSAGTLRRDELAPGILNLVKHPVLRWRTIILMYIWYVITRCCECAGHEETKIFHPFKNSVLKNKIVICQLMSDNNNLKSCFVKSVCYLNCFKTC